jgi:sialidase-1
LGAFNDSLVGPGRGLQLRSGPHAGRLLFAVHHGEGGPNTSAWKRTNGIFISDDGGHSWRLGATLPGMDEAQLAESGANGEITIASRVHSGPTFPGDACLLANGSWSTQECTLLATSRDGGETFGPITRNFDLFQPPGGCAPGLAADPEDLGAGHLFFSNPASRTARENMVVRRSTDSGRTWTDWRDPTTVVYSGPSAYSCLAPLFPAARWGHQRVGLLYERDAPGCTGPSCAIHFAPISTQ